MFDPYFFHEVSVVYEEERRHEQEVLAFDC
jgi:hypothetical protein